MRLLFVLAVVVAIAACSDLPDPGHYFLQRPNSILIHDDFWWSAQDCPECNGWALGATEGASWDAFVGASFFGSLLAHQFLLSEARFEGPVTVDFEYEVWLSDGTTFDRNGEAYDYRVVLASEDSDTSTLVGPSIELSLFFDTDGNSAGDSDVLRIREDASLTAEATSDTQPTGLFLERGSVSIVADPLGEPPAIEALVFGPDGVRVLTTRREFPDGWQEPFRIGLQISGGIPAGSLQIRAVDTITVKSGSIRE